MLVFSRHCVSACKFCNNKICECAFVCRFLFLFGVRGLVFVCVCVRACACLYALDCVCKRACHKIAFVIN